MSDEADRPIAAIQVVERPKQGKGSWKIIANVYVVPDCRRRGLATLLLLRVKHDHPAAIPSVHQSPDGAAWLRGVRLKQLECTKASAS
jgi:hypothetical protein